MRGWFKSLHGTAQPPGGEPEEWAFDYPWATVQVGFWLWQMSGFKVFPSLEDVRRLDPRWVSDLKLAHLLYSHQGDNSAVRQMFEKLQAAKDRNKRGPASSDDSDDDDLNPMALPVGPRR